MRTWRSVGIAGLILVATLGVRGPAGSSVPQYAQDLLGDVTNGKGVYERHCLRCHGPGGWGDGPQARELKVPPTNFHGPMTQMKSDEQLLTSVEFGVVMSPMHAFRGRLTDQDLQDVVAYLRLLGHRGR